MKVAIVFEIFFPTVNGVITSSVNLAENLYAQGHEVIFIAAEWDAFQEPVINGRFPVHYIQSSANWAYPGMRNVLPWNRKVQTILANEHVDILHITGPWLLTYAAVRAARRLRIPVVHTFHTMLHEPSYIIYLFRFRFLVPFAQAIAWWWYSLYVLKSAVNTGPSQMVADQLQEHFPDSDVRKISNGVDVERFDSPPERSAFQRAYPFHNDKTFLFVGRLGPEKSVEELIEAMAIVASRDEEVKLAIVGDGPWARRYAAQIRDAHLEDRVMMVGRIPHADLIASGLIHYSRAFVTASTTENQPMTVIEAICCHVPVIVPEVPGITELVDQNGITFRAHNVSSIAEAILSMARDDELHQRCVDATGAMRDTFDGRIVAQQFLEVYREVLRPSRR